MATNPMQRKARNSFLLGMLTMLIISGIIIAFLFMQLTNIKKAEKQEKLAMVTVYALNRDVDAGEEVTAADFTTTSVNKNTAPKDYLTPTDLKEKNITKIAMTAGTVLSKEMIYEDETEQGNDVRKQEYNMFVLPTDLQNGDYIDIRLMLPSGTDYIVASKKRVEIPQIAQVDATDTISVNLSEEETLLVSNAIIDACKIVGSKLYVTRYTEPGLQKASESTFPANKDVMALINANPNIVEEARQALWTRYNDGDGVNQRNNVISPAITNAGDQGLQNLQTKIEDSITNSQTRRKEYLDSLSAAPATTNVTTTTDMTNTTK
mgnify:CR=1 FL=1